MRDFVRERILEERIQKLEGALKSALDLIERGSFDEGYCMCGSSMESHTMFDGHSPVDAGDYAAYRVIEEIKTALDDIELSS